eukprot:8014652-Alexandrium_andersonii.AAC.1
MDDAPDVERCIVEAAGARLSPGKPETLQRRGTQCLPARRRGARAEEAAPKLGAHAWLGHLWREGN